MNKTEALCKQFTTAGAQLAILLSDRLKAADAEAHARVQEALGQGMHVALSMVTSLAGGPEIRLELVNADGSRLSLLSVNGRATLNA